MPSRKERARLRERERKERNAVARKRLLALRESRDLSQRQLASAIGADQPTISKIEQGKLGVSPELAEDLSRFFGISVDQFWGEQS